jgi:hypothetical protein
MNRRFAVLLLAFIPLFAADEALPSGASLMDRYIDVTGGKAAYAKHRSAIEYGHMEFAALGLKGTLVTYAAEPDKYYSSADLEGVGKLEMGVTNGIAWENNPLTGPRIKTGEEKLQALREARLNSDYHWRELYAKAETTGSETVDGEDCYQVTLTPAEGKPVKMYFGKKSGLLRKTTLVAASQMGDIPAELIAQEYRVFGGILAPAKVLQKAAGQEFTITIDNVKENAEIPADRFDLPAEIKALLEKAPQ